MDPRGLGLAAGLKALATPNPAFKIHNGAEGRCLEPSSREGGYVVHELVGLVRAVMPSQGHDRSIQGGCQSHSGA